MISGFLIKTTLVDYPGKVASSYFISGCNLRCPYCYNSELIETTTESTKEMVDFDTLLQHLEKRKNVLTGFVISGGEPLLHPELPEMIKKVKEMGYLVKLDTNGCQSKALAKLFENKDTRPDFVAVDLKTSPEKYHLLGIDSVTAEKQLQKSIEIISILPSNQREYRTVLVPPLVSDKEIPVMASLLPHDANWMFTQFRNDNCLDSSYNQISPYTEKELLSLVNLAQTYIKGAILR
jgi:pyruvate formate lyase activating enzyme